MSIGAPSNLGTLLIQRLDAVLGIGLSQQAGLAKDISPQAVRQPGTPESATGLQNPTQRDTREAVDHATAQGEQQAAVGKASREMQLANLLGRSTTLLSATQSAPTTLGYAARIILALINAYPEGDQTIRAQAPLLPTPGDTPPSTLAPKLAAALQQTLQTSGLFYESHLARLAAGTSSLPELHQEPQGKLPAQAPLATTAQLATQHNELPPPGLMAQQVQAQVSASHSGIPETGVTLSRLDTTSQTLATPGTTGSAHQGAVPGVDPQTQALVRQQLEVLANQSVAWYGEAWPGATLHWEVQHRDARDSGPQDFDGDHWATQLELSLPKLGDIQARLSLLGDQLTLRLTAARSVERLDGALEALRSRLLAKGLQPSQLSVAPPIEDGATPAHDAPHDSPDL